MDVACDKSVTENKLPTSTCACGKRAEGKSRPTAIEGNVWADEMIDSCTCGRSEDNGSSALETDFTSKK